MKKQIFFLVPLVLLLFASCRSQSKKEMAFVEPKRKVLCTTKMIADSIEKIVQELVEVEVLIEGEIDPHSYQLVKGDTEKIQEAEVLFCNGLNLEHGSSLKSAIAEHRKAVLLGDYIQLHYPDQILKVDGEYDPHIWMDVSVWALWVECAKEALIETFPEYREKFELGAKNLESNLKELDANLYTKIQQIDPEKRYLVTSHDAFNYFSRRYLATQEELENQTWLTRFKAPEGLSPDGQIGTYDIRKILDHLKEHRIAVVFPESNVSLDSLKKILSVAESEGVKVVFARDPLFGDSMSGDQESVETYEEMMLHNCRIISEYLNTYHPTS